MRYVDEYRAPEQVLQLIGHLKTRAALLNNTKERPLRIMEVCGGHTHAIFKFGLDQLLPENIEFIHGPGCPVCVLPMGRIDSCIEIASRPDVIFCTFGDAMRVPGKNGSLLQAKSRGADVRIVYSPMDALRLAQPAPFLQTCLNDRLIHRAHLRMQRRAGNKQLYQLGLGDQAQTQRERLIRHLRAFPGEADGHVGQGMSRIDMRKIVKGALAWRNV